MKTFFIGHLNNPVFKHPMYENISDAKWLTKMNVDSNNTIIGHLKDGYIHLFVSKDFLVPNVAIFSLLSLATRFEVKEIWLGVSVEDKTNFNKPIIKLTFS
jgi:hypothetical protein